jgi:hypothetical protein
MLDDLKPPRPDPRPDLATVEREAVLKSPKLHEGVDVSDNEQDEGWGCKQHQSMKKFVAGRTHTRQCAHVPKHAVNHSR